MRKFIAIATIAILTLAGCNKRVPQVAILSDNAFVDGSATVTLLLSQHTSTDVTIGLRYIETNSGASKALPGSAISFTNPVTIAAGSSSAQFKVYLDDSGLADGDYHAALAISFAQGASISRTNQVSIYAKVGQGDVPPVTDLTFMSDWSVKIDAFPYPYPFGEDEHIDIIATVPDISYFWVEANTQADLDKYYGGTVEGLISYFSSSISQAVAGGASITSQCFSADEANIAYANYWDPGQTTFYIMEFNASGKATGRYGKTAITLNDRLPFANKTGTWTLAYAGVQSYEYSPTEIKDSEFFTVGGTGSVPFSFILEDSGMIEDTNDLLLYIRQDFYDFFADAISGGATAEDLYYTAPGTYCSLFEACQGTFDAYIIGHNSATCLPNGDYAKITFTDTDGPAPAGAISARARRIGASESAGRRVVETKMLKSSR